MSEREKGRDTAQSNDKSPYTNRKFQKCKVTTQKKNATKNFHYTIADQLVLCIILLIENEVQQSKITTQTFIA